MRNKSNLAIFLRRVVTFSSVHHLSIYFPKNFSNGEESTRIYYIGLKGEFSEAHHHGVTICNYEAWANPSDHKAGDSNFVNNMIQ
jgi:hypothetical protein